jgi:hypothetical protein
LEEAKEKGHRTIERAKEITTKNKESKITYTTTKEGKGNNVQVTVRQDRQ